ncbi:YveK family protein [Modestobacter sp. Leaf380]|uniref:YveK family protein n=1 Tax=Modestobacter sp. Leaf380 TaxID=1736356 RepID=UPI0006F4771F|nr:Wzz/FepE/Etk N-terminal domain-containing protein [Modestobacter sp. Leaf380]KQS68788.1 hypothetical protein ASG41_07720 [Modestobacter sp. Leaf380]
MELREYAAVLTRRWRWLAALLVVCLGIALFAALASPKTWTAQTQVFVSSTTETNTSSQFVQQRVKSYPDVARSAEVLEPVLGTLGLDTTLAELRAGIVAENPADTSQINISVTDADPQRAARIADAVAEEFSSAVERLETTGEGTSPVALTVTNPATVPTSPTSPQVVLLLALGLVCGLGSGLAAALLRDRMDLRVWTPEDVRAAWGASVPDVLSSGTSREPSDRAAQVLARRIERRAQSGPVRVVLVSPTDRGDRAVAALADDLTQVLTRRGVGVGRTTSAVGADQPDVSTTPAAPAEGAPRTRPVLAESLAGSETASARPDVEFVTVPWDAALTRWRSEVAASDGVVVVCPAGSADRVDVFELGQLLDGVEATVVGVVFLSGPSGGFPGRGRRTRRRQTEAPVPGAATAPSTSVPAEPAGDSARVPSAPATAETPPPTATTAPTSAVSQRTGPARGTVPGLTPARQLAADRPAAPRLVAADPGWAPLTSPAPALPAEPGTPDEAADAAARPVLSGVEPAAVPRSNRVAGASRRASAASGRRPARVTARVPRSDTW